MISYLNKSSLHLNYLRKDSCVRVQKTLAISLHSNRWNFVFGEMGLSSLVSGRVFEHDQLPLKLKALSRCFRPEISTNAAESKLYRVHEFNKVFLHVFYIR